ncbi:MAG TPA: LAGLIDADG family homing endonuclease [Candidatus Lokiarchaeia archaeon]|nr:LAGLIDADG family homing endonuclease [Candidatus Lokiarchaeia archaeon]
MVTSENMDDLIAPQDPASKFEDFFRMFEDPVGTFVYLSKIKYIIAESEKTKSLVVDFTHLMRHDPQLAKEMHENPEYLKKANQAFVNILHDQSNGTIKLTDEYFVRFSNIPNNYRVKLRKIRAEHMERLFGVSGSLIRSTNVRPELMMASFECKICGAQHDVEQLDDEITYPSICNVGGCKNSKKTDFRLLGKTSRFIDWQQIRIQEMAEELNAGNVPRYVDALLLHDIVDQFRPGDRVTLVGVIKTLPLKKVNQGQGRVFQMIMHVNNIYTEEEIASEEITDEDEEKIKALAKEPLIHAMIVRSIAPGLYGMEDEKLAMALVLFGGVHKVRSHNIRGDIHTLIMGDPGTGKSQLIKAASKLAVRGIYTSGQGSTAAGLTAAVLRDETTGNMVLEAGALVLADNGVAAIDEFDKMRPQDRVAIHEAMEQQSYHPSLEILATDGSRLKIGPFVDNLIRKYKKNVIPGINCDILPFADLLVYTTDFKDISKTRVDRVSRHVAPDHFYKLAFSNGRSTIVTPEHPVFVFRDGGMTCIPASECKEDDFVPAPRYLPNSCNPVILKESRSSPDPRAKIINFPETLTNDLARILGYYVTEGYNFIGTTIEIGFSNMDHAILDEIKDKMLGTFGMTSTVNTRADGLVTLRYLSVELHKWMSLNFPEVIEKARFKRIPAKILGASTGIAKDFLATAFKGDGSIESTSTCFRTSSEGLSHDYQDLLLKLGIQSRIVHDISKDSYKVYIRGQSLTEFLENVVETDDPRHERIHELISHSQQKIRHHDVFPTSIAFDLIKLKKDLGLTYNGCFNEHLNKNYGITRNILEKELTSLHAKLSKVKEILKQDIEIGDIRTQIGYSMATLGKIVEVSPRKIDYYEHRGYDINTRAAIKAQVLRNLEKHVQEIENHLATLMNLKDARVFWDRIKKIEKIENSGENYTPYVYDITVEPSHTFIAQGAILHNTISISKAGIVANLNSRTSIIAAANPKLGRYDDNLTAAENINLQPTILSRFDLIFILKDKPNDKEDGLIADHILRLHMPPDKLPPGEESIEAPIDSSLLKKYIRYARTECEPQMTSDASQKIKEFYIKLRKSAEGDTAAPIPIVARTLEGLIRLSEAHAKMALRKEVLVQDVEAVVALQEKSMKQVSWDQEKQTFDVDGVQLGKKHSKQDRLSKLYNAIKNLQEEGKNEPVDMKDIIERARFAPLSLNEDEVSEVIEQLKKEAMIIEKKNGKFLVVKESK